MIIGVQSTKKQGCEWIYPLVNVYIAMENHHFKFGKSTINGPFSMAMLNYQRVVVYPGLVGRKFIGKPYIRW